MKRKLFWTIFILFVFFATGVFVFDRLYFFNQINENTESELETIASSIIASNLSIDVLNKFETTDDIVRDLLEDQRIDRSVRIFDPHGQLVFNNDLARDIEDTYSPQTWSEIVVGGHRLKRLTINTGEYILEVGLFLDPKIDRMKSQLNQLLVSLVVILILASIIAVLASEMIMRPLNNLGVFFVNYNLRHQADKSREKLAGEDIESLKLLSKSEDEVSVLARSLLTFLDQTAAERTKKSKDLHFLAHELKTPLSHIVIGLESLKSSEKDPGQLARMDRLMQTCKNLSLFIKDYLRVASIRSASRDSLQVSALHVEKVIQEIAEQINPVDFKRLSFDIKAPLTVLAERYHLESLIQNLISNALTYSENDVHVVLSNGELSISDSGAGFSEKSLQQMGEPFNRSGLEGSSGLGLTYCFEICRLYSWDLRHLRDNNKTTMSVSFNRDSIFEKNLS